MVSFPVLRPSHLHVLTPVLNPLAGRPTFCTAQGWLRTGTSRAGKEHQTSAGVWKDNLSP